MKMNIRTMLGMAMAVAVSMLAGCAKSEQQKITSVADVDRKAEVMKAAILHTATDIKVKGVTYYVSNDGDDSRDGRSPETAIKTLEKVNALELNIGDAVLFNRGDLWRGFVQTRRGVTYSAYGEGEKPRLYGSPYNAAKEGTWTETEVPDVYVYDAELPNDIGVLVFNEGESCAYKVMMRKEADGTTSHVGTNEPFSSYRDLKHDLDFYHDYKEARRIYLCSKEGNPSERFQSIEMNVKMNLIRAVSDVTVDNLCLKYVGAHAVGAGTVDTLTVTNCEIGWIGGSIQGEALFGRNLPTRYGNGVEIYGGCKKFTVDNCYIYQIYDAAVTHQHQGNTPDPLTMRNVTYSNNLIEDCVYSFEYFIGKPVENAERLMEHILIADNVARRAGMGWGIQRPDKETPAHIKSWAHHYNAAKDFMVRNNIFDRSALAMFNITAERSEWLPTLQGNVYLQHRNATDGRIGSRTDSQDENSNGLSCPFDEQYPEILKRLFGEEQGVFIYLE